LLTLGVEITKYYYSTIHHVLNQKINIMMINWRAVPFVRLFLPFALGIVAAEYGAALPMLWVNAILCVSILCVVVIAIRRVEFRHRWLFGGPLSIFLFLLGFQSVFYRNELNDDRHFKQFLTENAQTEQIMFATVTDFSERPNNYRLTLSCQKMGTAADSMHDCVGNALVYIRKDSSEKGTPQYGDLILIKSKIHAVEPPKNPDAFDFQKYLHRQNIHYQSFAALEDVQILAQRRGNPIQQFAIDCQKHLLAILKRHLTTDREFAVGSALLLGYRDAVDEDVRNAYVQTGSMHILAVSGMHILLIFNGLQWIFKAYKSGNRRFRWTKAILSLLLIWLFALITGLSASVLRAAVMATFLAVGQTIKRRGNTYNILAASAFMLLIWNPMFLLDVGFQLSYLAVIGIVHFYPKIQKMVISKNKIINWTWDALAIGFAAQLVVTPLSLYYFHQFPTYFWLSGLLAVPVSSAALYVGIALFFLDWVPYLSYILGKILFGCIYFMNEIIFSIQRFPLAVVDKLSFSLIAVLLFYPALIHIAFAIQSRKLRGFWGPLSIIIVLNSLYAFSTIRHSQQKRIVIYHVYKNSLIDFMDGETCYSFTKKENGNPDTIRALKFAADNHRTQLQIKEIQRFSFYDTLKQANISYFEGLCQFDSFRLGIIDRLPNTPIALPFDAILIRNNPRFSIEDLNQKIQFKQVILDASNSRYRVEKWKTMCITLGIPFYDIGESGAWSHDF
jgi:competence protein ComEC